MSASEAARSSLVIERHYVPRSAPRAASSVPRPATRAIHGQTTPYVHEPAGSPLSSVVSTREGSTYGYSSEVTKIHWGKWCSSVKNVQMFT